MVRQFEEFGGSSGFGSSPCVLVVDFIKGFTDPACALGTDFSTQLLHTHQLLEACRQAKIPIFFTTVIYDPHFRDAAHFIHKVPALRSLTAESRWVEIDDRLARQPDSEPLIIKKFASAFFGTHLQSFLTSEGIDTLIVTGCTTSGCVRATVVDGLQYGYRVVVPRECVGDRSIAAHEANLYDIQSKYADVISLPETLQHLSTLQ